MTQPIQAVQIYYEHPFGAEREVLREFFSFVGCLVKTTMMPVETILEKHKSLVNPGSERITHLFLTDRPPEGIVLSKNEIWCSFRILKRELAINGKAILCNADQKISAEQFEKAALDAIIHRIWKDEEAETQSLLYINAAFWQLDLFEFLQIKSTFQALKMGELTALPMRGHYYLPESAVTEYNYIYYRHNNQWVTSRLVSYEVVDNGQNIKFEVDSTMSADRYYYTSMANVMLIHRDEPST